jgi:hypothetical protein
MGGGYLCRLAFVETAKLSTVTTIGISRGERAMAPKPSISSSVSASSTACRHLAIDAIPCLSRHKRGIHEQITGSMTASFTESVV